MGDETDGLGYDRTLVDVNAYNLWNYLSAFLHINIITDMQVKTTYEVLVVECSPLDSGSSQLHRVHISHRSDSTRPAHLECHFVELRAGSLRLVFIGYSPTWTLGSITEDALLPQGVHLEHNTVGGNGKVLTLRVPITYIFINFFECLHFLHALTDLESPTARFHKVLIMTVSRQFFAK